MKRTRGLILVLALSAAANYAFAHGVNRNGGGAGGGSGSSTASGWTNTGSNIYTTDTSETVSIGTTATTSKLDILGSAFIIRGTRQWSSALSNPLSLLQFGIKGGTQQAGSGPSFLTFGDATDGSQHYMTRFSGIWENTSTNTLGAGWQFHVRRSSSDVNVLNTPGMYLTSQGQLIVYSTDTVFSTTTSRALDVYGNTLTRGYVDLTAITTPTAPSGTTVRLWNNTNDSRIGLINSASGISYLSGTGGGGSTFTGGSVANATTFVSSVTFNTNAGFTAGGIVIAAATMTTINMGKLVPEDWGAVGNVSTDDGPAFRAMIAYASTTFPNQKSLVELGCHKYYIGTPGLDWPSNLGMEGCGADVSVLVGTGTNMAMITTTNTFPLASSGTPVQNLYFANFGVEMGSVTETSYQSPYKGISIPNCYHVHAENLHISSSPATGWASDYGRDVYVENVTVDYPGRLSTSITDPGGSAFGIGYGMRDIEDQVFVNCHGNHGNRFGFLGEKQTGTGSNKLNTHGTRVIGGGFTDFKAAGIAVAGMADFTAIGVKVTSCTEGVIVAPALTVSTSSRLTFADLDISSCANNAYLVTGKNAWGGSDVGVLAWNVEMNVSGGRIYYCGLNGFRGEAANDNRMRGIHIRGVDIGYNGRAGVSLGRATSGTNGDYADVDINGNYIHDNGQNPTGSVGCAVFLSAPTTGFMMTQNHIYNSPGSTSQTGGIEYRSILSTAIIAMNIFDRIFPSSCVFNNGGTTTTVSIQGNLGFNNVNTWNTETLGASPYTSVADAFPRLYSIAGGTVSDISLNGVSVGTVTGTEVRVEPGETIVITYTIAPTLKWTRR